MDISFKIPTSFIILISYLPPIFTKKALLFCKIMQAFQTLNQSCWDSNLNLQAQLDLLFQLLDETVLRKCLYTLLQISKQLKQTEWQSLEAFRAQRFYQFSFHAELIRKVAGWSNVPWKESGKIIQWAYKHGFSNRRPTLIFSINNDTSSSSDK